MTSPPGPWSRRPRGVVRRNGPPGSADAGDAGDAAQSMSSASNNRLNGSARRIRATVGPADRRVPGSFGELVVLLTRLGELDLPRADLERLQRRPDRSVAQFERRGRPHNFEPGVTEREIALPKVEGS